MSFFFFRSGVCGQTAAACLFVHCLTTGERWPLYAADSLKKLADFGEILKVDLLGSLNVLDMPAPLGILAFGVLEPDSGDE